MKVLPAYRVKPAHRLLFLSLVLVLVLCAGVTVSSAKEPETVCIRCHGGLAGRLGAPVAAWRKSIHAANSISCHNCHGGDPTDLALAMSPGRGFIGAPKEKSIPAFCGRCHVGVKEDYFASAHGRALGRGGPHCVTCHGNHAVVTATPDLINRESCSRCHDYGRAEEIKAAVSETDQRITELGQHLSVLHRIGIATQEMEAELFALRNRFHRLFHNVDVDKVRSQTADFRVELGKISERINAIEAEMKQRKLWGGGVVALLVTCGILALLLFKSYRDEKP